jgi:beta-glucosidase
VGGSQISAGTLADKVAALLAELTTDEKVSLLHQQQPAVERLGLAAFHTGCEALHGVAWIGRATVFPQAVGLGATWNRDLVRRVGTAVGTEVRAFRQDPVAATDSGLAEKPTMVSLNVWAPVVNLLRDPRWGRNEEGYSEDPYATGVLATAYCTGLRGDHPTVWRTAPLLKHFLAYNVETGRDVVDVRVPERVLREYELPAFRMPIEAGVVAGVMPAYNLVNGIPNHVHPLLRDALHRWDPDLAICSDAFAPTNLVVSEKYFPNHVESHAAALKAGLDSYTDNNADAGPTIAHFTEALRLGLITEADLDGAVRRLLLMRARTGEFDPAQDPYLDIRADVIACGEHCRLAAEVAREAVVLLRNDGTLPLPDPATGAARPTVAVIGYGADRVLTDWYSGTLPYQVSIAEGLRRALGPDVVTSVEGADRIRLRITGTERVVGTFTHHDWGTSVQCPVAVHTLWDNDSGRYLTVDPESGAVAATAANPDGWVVHELWELHPEDRTVLLYASGVRRYVRVGEGGRLVADATDPAGATRFDVEPVSSGIDEATAAAALADHVIVVLGNDPHVNGRETVDRDGLALPAEQETLLRTVHAANPSTVLVLVSSYPYAVDWANEHLPAILWTAHGGQEQGTAIAEVLLGRYNPAGRLPQTWYAGGVDLPAPEDYDVIGSGWTYQYSRREHLFPFGHGLSFTTFTYSDLSVEADGDTVAVSVTVTNTGDRAGDEVVQLYSRILGQHPEPVPLRRLQGFERLTLDAGEARTVRFAVPTESLGLWSVTDGRLILPEGDHELLAGGSSAVSDGKAIALPVR